MPPTNQVAALEEHLTALNQCKMCPLMIGPVVGPGPVNSSIYLIGQAPGPHEGKFGKPFAWTAGKTLFRWFGRIGMDEEEFRSKVYMAAVCRCFPGKSKSGGDRVPLPQEIVNCSNWMKAELEILKPKLVIPVGRLAIEQVLGKAPLVDLIGTKFSGSLYGHKCDVIPLPHPSGASTWFKKEPGITLLAKALDEINNHPEWQKFKSI
ncbi:uracil-DNA glycosylase family protein [bacterium]|nr:uracil-DNA glycosylase family protein [bacterium]